MNDSSLAQLEKKIAGLERKLDAYVTAQSLAQVSRIYPKTKTVIFVCNASFSNNIKYAYLAFHEELRDKNVNYALFTQDSAQQNLLKAAGLPCLTPSDPRYLPTMLGAKVAVLDDNFYPENAGGAVPHALLQGAKFIQLWHGVPLKEIGLQSLSRVDVMAACGPFDTLVATNKSSRDVWAQRFSFRKFAALGYPRNDVFFRELTKNDLLNVDLETLSAAQAAQREGKPVLMYAPTFRDHAGPGWFEKVDITKLADFCAARGILFLVNLHPGEQDAVVKLRQIYPALRFVAPHTDIYPIVKHTDAMLTDYSSLAFDFLLLDRPVLFYRPDHQEYVTRARPLIPGRDHYTPGPVASTMAELIAATEATLTIAGRQDSDPFCKARIALRDELFDNRDGESGKRVYEEIMKSLEAPL
jgi:CDP-glycerol glycerophosphotransferase